MNQKETEKKIIDMLHKNEIVMGKLYGEFSNQFPLYQPLWHEIAGEEESHAAWIYTLYRKTEAGLVKFSESRFPIEAIQKNIDSMEALIEEAKAGKLSVLEALEKSVHLEHGMLEHRFFEVFKDDSIELQIILEALRLGTEEHFRVITRAWEKEKMGAEMEKKTA